MKSILQRALVVLLALVMVSTALVVVGSGTAQAATLASRGTTAAMNGARTVTLQNPGSRPASIMTSPYQTPSYWDKMSASVQDAVLRGTDLTSVAIYTDNIQALGNLLRASGVDTPYGLVPARTDIPRAVTIDVPANLLEKIAAQDYVYAVAPTVVPDPPAEGDDGVAAQTGQGPAPDLLEAAKGHHVTDAWALGYTGTGVNVAVMDSGIDFAHPDLQGTYATIQDPSSPYVGWPIAFDPYSSFAYLVYGKLFPTASGSWYVDTSFNTTADPVTGLIATPFMGRTYNVSGISSASGDYHLGLHPGLALRYWWWGEAVGVLVVDSANPGEYDTVYVDLNDDYQFGNDKPVSLASPVSWADYYNAGTGVFDASGMWDSGDGIADLSGGMVYFIGDGANPVPYTDILSGNYGIPLPLPPEPGSLVAFMIGEPYPSPGSSDHGTFCASAIFAQNVTGEVQGFAPGAKAIAVGDIYKGGFDFFEFVATGYDGDSGTLDDQAQVASASFGTSEVNNDGWDYEARWLDLMSLAYMDTAYVVSAGNGGFGFGTVTTPASSSNVITVGASTSYNAGVGFEPAAHSTFGDIVSWSARGPSALGQTKPDVVTIGSLASGDGAINAYGDGTSAWAIWGGTSLSAPATAGISALVEEAAGGLPNWALKVVLGDSADDIQYDPLVMGHGLTNALRAVDIVSMNQGLVAFENNPSIPMPRGGWSAGDYRGATYQSFARIMSPGQTSVSEWVLGNFNTSGPAEVTLSDWELQKIGSDTWSFDAVAAQEDPSDPAAIWPDYLFDLTDMVPGNADFVKVTLNFPFSQFDPDNDYVYEARWRAILYDWYDYNGNGSYWDDLNGNGVVNRGELDLSAGWEIMRFNYGYPTGDNIEVWVHDPLDRIHDGLLLGLQHAVHSSLIPTTNITITVDYYQAVDAPWLSESVTDLSVSPGIGTLVDFQVSLPADQPLGVLSGMIVLANDTWGTTQIPVIVNVAASGTSFSFGDDPTSTSFMDNNRVFGGFDWRWRAESGDWRFFFTDIPDTTSIAPGEKLLVHTWWENVPTDLDTIVFGPTMDQFSYYFSDLYGPYALATVGQSVNTYMGSGIFRFQTATGGAEEWVSAPLQTGLQEIALHNVLYAGLSPSEVFGGEVGTFSVSPNPWQVSTADLTGTTTFTASSSLTLPGLEVKAFGLAQPQNSQYNYINSTSPWTTMFSATDIGVLQIGIQESYYQGMDLDLYLYRWTGSGWAQVASSAGPTATEGIRLTMPQDGTYLVRVVPFAVPAGTGYFDYMQAVVAGSQLIPSDVPTTTIPAGTPAPFNVSWDVSAGARAGWNYGVFFVGPTGAPAVEVDAEFYLYDVYAPEILTTTPADGGYTNDPAPHITVTYVDPYITSGISHVELYFDGMNLPGPGSWNDTSFEWSFPFNWADGEHYAYVYVYDNEGNSGFYLWTFTVDTIRPGLNVVSPAITLTNVTTVDVAGTTDVDATVRVNGVPVDVDPVTGAFAATVDLVEGPNLLTTIASDAAGNTATDLRTIVLDTIPPELAVATPGDGDLLNSGIVHISGTSEVGASLVVNGVAVVVNPLGTWAVDLAFSDGLHTLTTTAMDAAGNMAQDVRTFTVDTTAPALSVTSPAYSLTNAADVTVEGMTEVGATVTVNGNAVTVGGDGSFSTSVTLVEGLNTIEVEATDAAGNTAIVTKDVTLDSVAPALAITAPTNGALLKTAVVHVTGTAEPGSRVTVNGVLVVVSGGAWSVDLAFSDGAHTITVVATDSAGNQATATRSVTIDTVAPVLNVISPTATLTKTATVTVSGTTEVGATLTVNGIPVTVGGSGAFTTSISLVSGTNTITIVATDAAGNSATVTRTLVLDTTPPVVTVTAPADNLATNRSTVVVTGTVDDITATVLVNGVQVQPDAQGDWSVSVALAEGSNTITVSGVDPAGNQAAATTLAVTYTSPVPGLQNGINSNTGSINGLSNNLLLGLIAVLVVALAAIGVVYFLLNRKISAGGQKPEQP